MKYSYDVLCSKYNPTTGRYEQKWLEIKADSKKQAEEAARNGGYVVIKTRLVK